jgi:cobaltochelatase CobN
MVMMSKIIYLSNIDRRSIKMQTAIKDLQAEGLLSPDAVYLRVKTDSIWTEKMDRTLADADLVLMKLMGGSLDTPFFRRLLVYLREHRIKYYINTSGAREDNLQGGLQEAEMLQFKKYDLYNGMPNFRNMLLYAQFLCDGKTGYAQPEHAPWCGIYHPDAKQVYTDLAAYCKDFCKEGAATVGILFYRDEWIWGRPGISGSPGQGSGTPGFKRGVRFYQRYAGFIRGYAQSAGSFPEIIHGRGPALY